MWVRNCSNCCGKHTKCIDIVSPKQCALLHSPSHKCFIFSKQIWFHLPFLWQSCFQSLFCLLPPRFLTLRNHHCLHETHVCVQWRMKDFCSKCWICVIPSVAISSNFIMFAELWHWNFLFPFCPFPLHNWVVRSVSVMDHTFWCLFVTSIESFCNHFNLCPLMHLNPLRRWSSASSEHW